MNKYVETFTTEDETLISISVPDKRGDMTQISITPEIARNIAFELFDAYLSVA